MVLWMKYWFKVYYLIAFINLNRFKTYQWMLKVYCQSNRTLAAVSSMHWALQHHPEAAVPAAAAEETGRQRSQWRPRWGWLCSAAGPACSTPGSAPSRPSPPGPRWPRNRPHRRAAPSAVWKDMERHRNRGMFLLFYYGNDSSGCLLERAFW